MALYSYEAFSKNGKKVRGVIDAPTKASVKDQLARQGLFPISIEPATQEAQYGLLQRLMMRGVSGKDKILFTRQLSILLKSGIPLLQAVELLIDQFHGRMRIILVTIKDDLKEGISFADALQKYPNIFETIYVQLVRAGEATGRLEAILDRLTDFLERRAEIQKKVKGALQYPLIQLVVAIAVVVILLIYVVPQMAQNFAAQGKALPGPTQLVMSLSDFVTGHYLLLISILAVMFGSFRYWSKTTSGAYMLDKIKLRIPLVKYLSRTNAVVQFSYTLGMLLEGGVNLSDALDITVDIIDNRILSDALSKARDNIVKEGKIAQYLKETGMFPPIAIYLIQTGEQSGELDKMLLQVAKNYEEELIGLTDRLTGLLGPIMLVLMAIVVGFIVMAVALPMFDAINLSEI